MIAAFVSRSKRCQKHVKLASAPPTVTSTERSVAPAYIPAMRERSSSEPFD